MNKKAKEHLIQFILEVETIWLIIVGLFCALVFDMGLIIGIIWGKH